MSYEDIDGMASRKKFAYIAIRELLVGRIADIKAFTKRIRQAQSEAEISRIMFAVRQTI